MHNRSLLATIIFLAFCSGCAARTSQNTPAIPAVATQSLTATVSPSPAPATSTPTLLPVPPNLPVYAAPVLVNIHFQDALQGWGIASNDGGALVRSVDGGLTWYNATPMGASGLGNSTGLFTLGVEAAWMLVTNPDFYTGTLYRTFDGGLTWSQASVPFGGALCQFIDQNIGRCLASLGYAAGSQAVALYQTADGGATWVSVYSNDPTRPDPSSGLPFSGIKNGLTFIDPNTGWVTGSRPQAGDVYLFVTHDGGATWSQQSLPLPAELTGDQFVTQAPVFFGQDGYLPIMIYTPDSLVQTFYKTRDGGATWSANPATSTGLLPHPGIVSFTDEAHGFVWDGGKDLYATTYGSAGWSTRNPDLDLSGRLSQLEFVPGPTGDFFGWVLTGPDEAGHTQLYGTQDGGLHWTVLLP